MSTLPDDDQRLLEVLVAMVVADGDADPQELEVASRFYEELTGQKVDVQTLRTRAMQRLRAPEPSALPEGVGRGLDEIGKRRVLLAALAIAEADGFVLEEEDALLARLVEELGLPPEAYREAVEGRLSLEP